MKVLILGGHGFIGHHVARILNDLSHQVHIVDLHHRYGEYQSWEYNPVSQQRIDHIGAHSHYFGDVSDKRFMDMIFDNVRPHRVIDLATYPNALMVKKNVLDATNNMISATAIALDLCVQYQVERFVFASSSMVYGDITGVAVENQACHPLTLYGSYKLQGESMCKIWHKEHGLEYSILRPSALYGNRDMVVRVISKMTVSAIKHGSMTVKGTDSRLDFTDVTDVASAFVTACLDHSAANEIYNCTRGYGRRIQEAAEIIRSRIPSEISIQPKDDFYPSRDTLDSTKLMEQTSWKPIVDIEQGIPNYLDWFLSQSYLERF